MFDKFLCKHIQKKTILVWDVVDLFAGYCLVAAFLLISCSIVGMFIWGMCGMEPAISITQLIFKSIAIGGTVLVLICISGLVILTIFKIEVAHCPKKDDKP